MKKDDNKGQKRKSSDPYDFFKLDPGPGTGGGGDKKPALPLWGILLIVVGVTIALNSLFARKPENLIEFSQFRGMIQNGQILAVELGEVYFVGYGSVMPSGGRTGSAGLGVFSTPASSRSEYRTVGVLSDRFLELLDSKGVEYRFVVKQNSVFLQLIMNLIFPVGFLAMYFFLFRRMGGGMMSGILPGHSKAGAIEEGQVKTRFDDVAGVDEAKEELVEVVDFLKSPQKYIEIGGRIPKGVLLVGPPGTGKTLLARAVAGEAGVSFFRISGSDFVEMFVGVGASRVRDLFQKARDKSPCIIFIDELDAIGKSRVSNFASNDEREQTLNQLLVEMDGFDNEKGLIVLAATNRPDVLDHALLRPGRFDRQVVVDKPDVKGREAILKIHSKNVKLGSEVDLTSIARTTSGFAGADLANVINEAALLAVRGGRKTVGMQDLDEAVEKAIAGLQKKTRVIKEEERRIVAFHETGHALVAANTAGADKVHKISIIPRGISALGYTLQMPEEDRYLRTSDELFGEVDVLLGGRAAEQIVFGKISTGAGNDIQRATDIVRHMITEFGMSERFKNVALSKRGAGYGGGQDPTLVREYSEATQQYIDDQIAARMQERYQVVIALLESKRQLLDYIAARLLEKETIEETEFQRILGAEHSLAERQAAPEKDAPPDNHINHIIGGK
ncbi:MAG: ATP-dependent zinc metalloprotease FtsH [Spirochaetaceae bacterium]|jgi:cell division protease FtsH|nr:ATP-dependent zinc metalloprotease FtsH [Spirochaetaceae bacterium]